MQLELFDTVLAAYGQGGVLRNEALYDRVAQVARIPVEKLNARQPIGRAKAPHSTEKRRIRWTQQTLRQLGLIERDEAGGRGTWRITPAGKKKLTPAAPKKVLLGFSTKLGVALWASCDDVFAHLDEPIHLMLSSPPYPLRQPRAYGNPTTAEYVDWLCAKIEPIVRHLVPGGSICLNLSNDIFEPGSPERSLYQERLLCALYDRLGLRKLDMLIWENPTKPPGPIQWASKTRQQLNVTWEPIWWLSNDPAACLANNRRILEPHTESHIKLLARGGEQRTATYGDGAYRLYEGSFGLPTEGRIPRNILRHPHRCKFTQRLRKAAVEQGLPTHGATMPLSLCSQLVEFLTEPGHTVVDPFSGWFKTAKAAELAGRRWIGTEIHAESVLGASNGFTEHEGFESFGGLA